MSTTIEEPLTIQSILKKAHLDRTTQDCEFMISHLKDMPFAK